MKTIIAVNYKHLVYAKQSDDGTWSTGTASIGHRSVALAVESENIYVGTDGHGVLRTSNYGETWTSMGLDGHIVRSLAISKVRPGMMVAGTKPAHLFISYDYGENWEECHAFRKMKRWFWLTPAEMPISGYVMDIALSPTDPDVMIVGIEAAGLLRSVDGGKIWEGHPDGGVRDCHALDFHPTDGNWVYEGGGGSAAFSNDGGKTWKQPDPLSLSAIVSQLLGRKVPDGKLGQRYGWAVGADPAQPNIWYFSASTGPGKAHGEGDAQAYIYRCRDGQNWERLSGGLPQPLNDFPYALLTDVNAPGHVYAVLQNGDIWHSENHGDNWAQLDVNIGSMWYRAVLV